MSHRPILIISGTNRPGSSTLKVARAVDVHYRQLGLPAELYSLTELPPDLFTPHAYASKPDAFLAVQQKVLDCAGLHVVTPEYNGSFPGVLKYFIDMLKFPESFDRKPVAFVGVAAGMWGALRAVEQLQLVFGYRNAHVYPDRVFVPDIVKKLAPDGGLTDKALDDRIGKQAKGFHPFANHFGA